MIALTATATPVVQNDIAEQLGLAQPARFIHGFRRDNIAIEVVEVAPSQRAALTLELLLEEAAPAGHRLHAHARAGRRLAAELAAHFPCAAYHAGLDAEHRKRVQEEFLDGRIAGDGGDHRVRHGDRQARCPHRDPHRAAGEPGSVLPGDRPRRPRRQSPAARS